MKYNATFWHEGKVIGSGYGSSVGVALQRGARKIASAPLPDHTFDTNGKCTLENVRVTFQKVGN